MDAWLEAAPHAFFAARSLPTDELGHPLDALCA
jgi:hypothetical protein